MTEPEDYKLTLSCYLSDQMTEKQWQEHLLDPLFLLWVKFCLAKSAVRNKDAEI